MKIFALLMAIMVLVQSILPCADANSAGHVAKTSVAKAAKEQLPQRDDCSPFCHCSCCASFAVDHCVAYLEVPLRTANTPQAAHIPANIIQIALPIWQPPRLV